MPPFYRSLQDRPIPLVFLFILLSSLPIKGQDEKGPLLRKVDSLNRKATKLRFEDPERVNRITGQAYELAEKEGYQEGMIRALDVRAEMDFFFNSRKLAYEGFKKADSIRSTVEAPITKGQQCLELGIILMNRHEYAKADSLFQRARTAFKKGGDIANMGRAERLRSSGHFYQNRYPNALKSARRSLELYDSAAHASGKAKAHQQIGRIHRERSNDEKARKAFKRSEELARKTGNDKVLANAHDHIGRYYARKEALDRARHHFERAIEHHRKAENEKGEAYSSADLAKTLLRKGKADSSEMLCRKALKVFREFRDPTGIIKCLRQLGKIHRERGQPDSALARFQKALPWAHRIKSHKERAGLFELIAETHNEKGQEGKAYDALKKASLYEDSLALRQQEEKMAELEAKYEMREKEKELQLKEAELQRKAVVQYALMGGAGLLLLFSGFFYYQFRQKKKANIALQEKNHLIEEKNKEILESLRYASKIQDAVLPNEASIQEHFSSGFILYKPRDMVSGDLYWMGSHGYRFFMAVVDCTGHGVPGAMISILGHNGLNKAINEMELEDPGDILSFLDRQLKETLGRTGKGTEMRDGMDVALCSFDSKEQKLTFAGAIEPLYLIRNGSKEVEEIKGDRQPIGGIVDESEEKKLFTSHRIELQKGDRFYIFSDGFPDQFGGEKGKKLKHKKFKRMLEEKGGRNGIGDQGHQLDERFEEWKGSHEQVDDVLVIGAQV